MHVRKRGDKYHVIKHGRIKLIALSRNGAKAYIETRKETRRHKRKHPNG